MAACKLCDLVLEGPDWGYMLSGPSIFISDSADWCKHASAQRYCSSCSTDWWQEGLDEAWDVDGCVHRDCPTCVAADAAETAGTRTFAAAVDLLMPGAGR